MKNYFVVNGEISARGEPICLDKMAAVRNLFTECFSNCLSTHLWESGNRLAGVVSFETGLETENINTVALQANKWISELNQSLHLTVNVGVSGPHSDYIQVSQACREAQEMVNRIFVGNTVRLYGYREEKLETGKVDILTSGAEKILNGVDPTQPQLVQRNFYVFFQNLQHRAFCFSDLQTMMMLFLGKVFRETTPRKMEQSDFDQYRSFGRWIMSCQSLNTLYCCAEEILRRLLPAETGESVYESKLKRKVDQYIKDNYRGIVNLNALANELHLNPSYVSRAYKRDAGISVIAALNAYRIERAKCLLESGEYNVSQVADAVGIYEPDYFGKIFKKYTGKTPKAFLAANSGKD